MNSNIKEATHEIKLNESGCIAISGIWTVSINLKMSQLLLSTLNQDRTSGVFYDSHSTHLYLPNAQTHLSDENTKELIAKMIVATNSYSLLEENAIDLITKIEGKVNEYT